MQAVPSISAIFLRAEIFPQSAQLLWSVQMPNNWMSRSSLWWTSVKIWPLTEDKKQGYAKYVEKKGGGEILWHTSKPITLSATFPTLATSVERFPGQDMGWDYTKQTCIANENIYRTRDGLRKHKVRDHKFHDQKYFEGAFKSLHQSSKVGFENQRISRSKSYNNFFFTFIIQIFFFSLQKNGMPG